MSRKQYNRPLKTPPAPGACRECGNRLATPATVKRGMCRSCWRVHKVVTALSCGESQNKGPTISDRTFTDVVVTKPPASPNTTRLTQGLAAMTRPFTKGDGVT